MFFDRVVKSAFYMSEGSIWWKTKLSKILSFILSISDTERIFLGFMWNFLQPGCRNCILRVYRNNLRRIFCGKKCSFIISEHRSRESSRPSGIYFSKGLSKLHSTNLLEPLVETFFGEKRYIFFTVFGQGVELFWILSKFFRQACQNRILLHQRNTLGKNLYSKKLTFHDFHRSFSHRNVRTALYVLSWKVWGKLVLPKTFFLSIVLEHWAESF